MSILNKKGKLNKEDIFGIREGLSLKKEELIGRLKKPDFYSRTGLKESERISLTKKLFEHTDYINETKIKQIEKELKLGKFGRFKNLPPDERRKAEKLIKGILKK